MGLFKKSCYTNPDIDTAPDPKNFKVLNSIRRGGFWVSCVQYPNCTNFEGKKILLTTFDPNLQTELDPHFRPNVGIIARFIPNAVGWNMAETLASELSS